MEDVMAEETRIGLNVSILVAVIGLVGGVIGAFVTATATSRASLRQNALELRTKAYSEFLQGQTFLRTARNDGETQAANRLIIEAKFNILMLHKKTCYVQPWFTG